MVLTSVGQDFLGAYSVLLVISLLQPPFSCCFVYVKSEKSSECLLFLNYAVDLICLMLPSCGLGDWIACCFVIFLHHVRGWTFLEFFQERLVIFHI